MSEQTTREVCVLSEFTERDGTKRMPGDVFTVAYQTIRQRERVNQAIFRGYLTLDLESAKGLRKG